MILANQHFVCHFTRMLKRLLSTGLIHFLHQFPVVAIAGCRQVGKTTLAFQIKEQIEKEFILYLKARLILWTKIQSLLEYMNSFAIGRS